MKIKLFKVLKGDDENPEIKAIFQKEAPVLLKKINDWFKKSGVIASVTQSNSKIWFSDGYHVQIKFNGIDNKGKPWWQWLAELEASPASKTSHLQFYSTNTRSNNGIYLKASVRPESHPGSVRF